MASSAHCPPRATGCAPHSWCSCACAQRCAVERQWLGSAWSSVWEEPGRATIIYVNLRSSFNHWSQYISMPEHAGAHGIHGIHGQGFPNYLTVTGRWNEDSTLSQRHLQEQQDYSQEQRHAKICKDPVHLNLQPLWEVAWDIQLAEKPQMDPWSCEFWSCVATRSPALQAANIRSPAFEGT